MSDAAGPEDTSQVGQWRPIVTLVVFILTNVIVLFPLHVPVLVPRRVANAFLDALALLRILAPRPREGRTDAHGDDSGKTQQCVRLNFALNFITGPLIADLFLLAVGAIGRAEVHGGIIGADNISPIDIMVFFITLAYIAISIDASGIIRYLAFRLLQWGGKAGHRLFLCLYSFFFLLGSFIGNDPIILSGTPFLAYMTRVSNNIAQPRAWIHSQFAIANIASAILVSSNPTNLVLAGAFSIRFIDYTANMIVPVLVTALILFPFLLYIVFANESLIPRSIKMHQLPDHVRARKPINPNIPHARGHVDGAVALPSGNEQEGKLLSLEEIMNPFLDKGGAAFGAAVMAATLITVLALNAASAESEPPPVFWVTLPAALVMFLWDLGFGWYHREETRRIARRGRQELEEAARAERVAQHRGQGPQPAEHQDSDLIAHRELDAVTVVGNTVSHAEPRRRSGPGSIMDANGFSAPPTPAPRMLVSENTGDEKGPLATTSGYGLDPRQESHYPKNDHPSRFMFAPGPMPRADTTDGPEPRGSFELTVPASHREPATLVSLARDALRWSQETFPTATAVVVHLPLALVPFAFCMFVLVQGLVTNGWVPVFAQGWDRWVDKTGTVGSIAGMAFLSVVLCNFAGTNIGTTILLSRVIQSWQAMHRASGTPISDRTFWATVYSMALGVNYGAFSIAFSASLAGLLWRDILIRKHIRVRSLDFARVNLPIITNAMIVGCSVLVGQIYITRGQGPYDA